MNICEWHVTAHNCDGSYTFGICVAEYFLGRGDALDGV